jgi:hypothetical protein
MSVGRMSGELAQQLADGGDRPLADIGLLQAVSVKSLTETAMAVEQAFSA